MVNVPILLEQAGSSVGEHRPYKPRVAGSSPAPPTIALRALRCFGKIGSLVHVGA